MGRSGGRKGKKATAKGETPEPPLPTLPVSAPAAEPEHIASEPAPEPAPKAASTPRAVRVQPPPPAQSASPKPPAPPATPASRLAMSVLPLLDPPWSFQRLYAARQELLPAAAALPPSPVLDALTDTLTRAAAFLQRTGLTAESFDAPEPGIGALLADLLGEGLAWLKALASGEEGPPLRTGDQLVLEEIWALESHAWRLVPVLVPPEGRTLAAMDAYRSVIQGLLAFVLAPGHDAGTRARLVAACYGLLLRALAGAVQMANPAGVATS